MKFKRINENLDTFYGADESYNTLCFGAYKKGMYNVKSVNSSYVKGGTQIIFKTEDEFINFAKNYNSPGIHMTKRIIKSYDLPLHEVDTQYGKCWMKNEYFIDVPPIDKNEVKKIKKILIKQIFNKKRIDIDNVIPSYLNLITNEALEDLNLENYNVDWYHINLNGRHNYIYVTFNENTLDDRLVSTIEELFSVDLDIPIMSVELRDDHAKYIIDKDYIYKLLDPISKKLNKKLDSIDSSLYNKAEFDKAKEEILSLN